MFVYGSCKRLCFTAPLLGQGVIAVCKGVQKGGRFLFCGKVAQADAPAGQGVAAVAASPANLIDIKSFLKFATIGPDKMNQLMHARYFKNSAGLKAHMKKHAAILKPKFDSVYKVLDEELGGLGIAEWTTPCFSSFRES